MELLVGWPSSMMLVTSCAHHLESRAHLFFTCLVTREIWKKVLWAVGMSHATDDSDMEVEVSMHAAYRVKSQCYCPQSC